MTAQSTPQQWAEWFRRIRYGTTDEAVDAIDAIFDAGHAATLEGVDLTRVQKWAIVRSVSPQEAAMLPHDDPNYRVFRSGSQP